MALFSDRIRYLCLVDRGSADLHARRTEDHTLLGGGLSVDGVFYTVPHAEISHHLGRDHYPDRFFHSFKEDHKTLRDPVIQPRLRRQTPYVHDNTHPRENRRAVLRYTGTTFLRAMQFAFQIKLLTVSTEFSTNCIFFKPGKTAPNQSPTKKRPPIRGIGGIVVKIRKTA